MSWYSTSIVKEAAMNFRNCFRVHPTKRDEVVISGDVFYDYVGDSVGFEIFRMEARDHTGGTVVSFYFYEPDMSFRRKSLKLNELRRDLSKFSFVKSVFYMLNENVFYFFMPGKVHVADSADTTPVRVSDQSRMPRIQKTTTYYIDNEFDSEESDNDFFLGDAEDPVKAAVDLIWSFRAMPDSSFSPGIAYIARGNTISRDGDHGEYLARSISKYYLKDFTAEEEETVYRKITRDDLLYR